MHTYTVRLHFIFVCAHQPPHPPPAHPLTDQTHLRHSVVTAQTIPTRPPSNRPLLQPFFTRPKRVSYGVRAVPSTICTSCPEVEVSGNGNLFRSSLFPVPFPLPHFAVHDQPSQHPFRIHTQRQLADTPFSVSLHHHPPPTIGPSNIWRRRRSGKC